MKMKNNNTYYLVNKEDTKVFEECFSLKKFHNSYCWRQKHEKLIIIVEDNVVMYHSGWSWVTLDDFESVEFEEVIIADDIELIDFKKYLRLYKLKRIIGDDE